MASITAMYSDVHTGLVEIAHKVLNYMKYGMAPDEKKWLFQPDEFDQTIRRIERRMAIGSQPNEEDTENLLRLLQDVRARIRAAPPTGMTQRRADDLALHLFRSNTRSHRGLVYEVS
jgi:hypothetical protein